MLKGDARAGITKGDRRLLQGDARTPAQKRQGARAWNAVQKVSLKGDARTAAQKAKDRNQVGNTCDVAGNSDCVHAQS
eukprot:COSAG01_NODE_30947_length_606_cov_1.869822_1_plen_78_part_00